MITNHTLQSHQSGREVLEIAKNFQSTTNKSMSYNVNLATWLENAY